MSIETNVAARVPSLEDFRAMNNDPKLVSEVFLQSMENEEREGDFYDFCRLATRRFTDELCTRTTAAHP